MTKQQFLMFALVVGIMLMSACAAHPNPMAHTPGSDGSVAGFWLGLWHGMICPLTFIISLFTDSIHFYEVHNNGGWYNFGFLLGAGAVVGGSSQASS
jgi:hypothetical protein